MGNPFGWAEELDKQEPKGFSLGSINRHIAASRLRGYLFIWLQHKLGSFLFLQPWKFRRKCGIY
jgi:hypothetical protein